MGLPLLEEGQVKKSQNEKRVLDPGRQLAMADMFRFLWIFLLSFSFSPSVSSFGKSQAVSSRGARPVQQGRALWDSLPQGPGRNFE